MRDSPELSVKILKQMIYKDIQSFDRLTDMAIKELHDRWAGTSDFEVYSVTKETSDSYFVFYPTNVRACYIFGDLIRIAEATNMNYYVSLKKREDGSYAPALRCY